MNDGDERSEEDRIPLLWMQAVWDFFLSSSSYCERGEEKGAVLFGRIMMEMMKCVGVLSHAEKRK